MSKARKSSIEVQGTAITVLTQAIDVLIWGRLKNVVIVVKHGG